MISVKRSKFPAYIKETKKRFDVRVSRALWQRVKKHSSSFDFYRVQAFIGKLEVSNH